MRSPVNTPLINYFNPRAPRGARPHGGNWIITDAGISIHAPREGRDLKAVIFVHTINISIHAPREGRDHPAIGRRSGQRVFQSTRPARGATEIIRCTDFNQRISIHAPREGRDL